MIILKEFNKNGRAEASTLILNDLPYMPLNPKPI
jgi:hypothetical protein